MSYDIGDLWTPELTVKDAAGTLTAATVTLAVTAPDGTASAPAVSTASTGVYTADVLLTQDGYWLATWTVTGAVTGVESQTTYVRRHGAVSANLSQIKDALNKTLSVDDDELDRILDAAVDCYEEKVGPFGTVTETLHGGRTSLLLSSSRAQRITSAAYSDGTAITLTDLDLDPLTGIVHWGYNTAGAFTYGVRNVIITYTVALPAHHREVIIADVAGYFAATQRGGSSGPRLPGEGYADAYEQPGAPLTLFPRIAALAASYPVIA